MKLQNVTYNILYNTQVVCFLCATEDSWEIPRSEFEVGVKLGEGNFEAVFKGQLRVTAMSPKIYAHKQEMEFEGKSHYSTTLANKLISGSFSSLLSSS